MIKPIIVNKLSSIRDDTQDLTYSQISEISANEKPNSEKQVESILLKKKSQELERLEEITEILKNTEKLDHFLENQEKSEKIAKIKENCDFNKIYTKLEENKENHTKNTEIPNFKCFACKNGYDIAPSLIFLRDHMKEIHNFDKQLVKDICSQLDDNVNKNLIKSSTDQYELWVRTFIKHKISIDILSNNINTVTSLLYPLNPSKNINIKEENEKKRM